MRIFKKLIPVIALIGLMPLIVAAGPDSTRAYSAAHFVLELDQTKEVGFIRKESKEDAKCQDASQSKHTIGPISRVDFAFEGDMSIGKGLQEWIQASFSNATYTKLEPTGIEYPNLQITMSLDDAQVWQDYYEDFVIRGNCDQDDELSGSVTFLAPDQETELGQINLKRVGIVTIDTENAEASTESIRRFKVELYVETMDLEYGAGIE